MTFETSNASTTFGHQSAHAASLALNPGGTYIVTNSSGLFQIGVVRTPMPQGKVRLVVRRGAAEFGAGESQTVLLRWLLPDGATQQTTLATLDASTVPTSGETVVAEGVDVGQIPPGTAVALDTVYVAGAPNDPSLSLAIQMY